ncbi:GtrA family protein [Vibrio salinus]|uniref:GtrA family protein n=1 Tax=Vibrio salinus TaxID=2899784 RepID=UPI001E637B9D|nr:GtrA family protein [Vibrio salinus]MCE0494826.1 GtrA family protein [Vibrio salinus]
MTDLVHRLQGAYSRNQKWNVAGYFVVFLCIVVTCFNMHIALLETVAHDALPFMESYAGKFTSEGRWINFILFPLLRQIPQLIAFPLCNVFVFIFGYQVIKPLIREKWLVVCFALTLVHIPYFTMLFKWPMTLVAGIGLLALFACLREKISFTAMFLTSGILLFATYPAFYFLIPLIYIARLSEGSAKQIIKFVCIWIAGYILGYVVAQLAVYWYTLFIGGQGHFIEFAGWRKSTPVHNLISLFDNIEKSAGNFERNALYLSRLSPLFFIPVFLIFLINVKQKFKYLLVVFFVIFSIYASVIALGVKVPLRSGITLPIGLIMIALLTPTSPGKVLLMMTLFIPFSYSTYGYNYAYHEKRVVLRGIIEPADPNGYLKMPERFKKVIVKVDEQKTSQYFYQLTRSKAFKNTTNLREHYIKPYLYTYGWKENEIAVVDISVAHVTGKADVETKGDNLYLIIN